MSNKPKFEFSRMRNSDGIRMSITYCGKTKTLDFMDAMSFDLNPISILPVEFLEFSRDFYRDVERFRKQDADDAESVIEAR